MTVSIVMADNSVVLFVAVPSSVVAFVGYTDSVWLEVSTLNTSQATEPVSSHSTNQRTQRDNTMFHRLIRVFILVRYLCSIFLNTYTREDVNSAFDSFFGRGTLFSHHFSESSSKLAGS